MVEDDQVPFVNTISRISLSPQGDFTEYVLDQKMPGLEGASSEFLINSDLSESPSNILTFNSQGSDTLDLGYIYGGIYSRSRNPFMQNNTESTEARDVMYHVRLIPRSTSGIPQRRVDRENPFQMKVFPNPTSDVFTLHLEGPTFQEAHYFISTPDGRWIDRGTLRPAELTEGKIQFAIDASVGANTLFITIVLDNTYYLNEKLVLNP
jgi:hypothetical protein